MDLAGGNRNSDQNSIAKIRRQSSNSNEIGRNSVLSNSNEIGANPPKKIFRICSEEENSYAEIFENKPTTIKNLIDYKVYRLRYPRRKNWPQKATNVAFKRDTDDLPPREYELFRDFPRSITETEQKREFFQSCQLKGESIQKTTRNWIIVDSIFDLLNENVFKLKNEASSCPGTVLTRAAFPPINFKLFYDALIQVKIQVAGLYVFIAVGHDWSAIPTECPGPTVFTTFIYNFAVRFILNIISLDNSIIAP
ncbi:unnamed protein product [Dracunculus medinensis]|uniref:Uncharacterized protein n=1 Tax=Dracunculus medinensis TaxID=318479 RepID=A0A0N4U9Z1_DRAME|nr:unnamed protein product [Dracunculus medinensis]